MSPLAGRPPFATDEPDSHFKPSDQKSRHMAPPNPRDTSRSSTYDVYDSYLNVDKPPQNRNSGVGAAFMNGDMEDSDSEDEDISPTTKPMDPHHTPISIPVPEPVQPGKHAALAAATGARNIGQTQTSPPQYKPQNLVSPPPPAIIAAPRPGYAAPISALNNAADSQQQTRHVPPGIQVPTSHVAPGSPSPTSPHPLQAPLTPIQPVFARPRPPKENPDVKFSGDIMGGEKESGILPKRGERGDDFWRRFSMVVKDEGTKREKMSPWLRKTQSGTSSWSRWIWIIGVILVIAAAGGIGIGWYISHQSPDHYQPTAIGGSANEAADIPSSVKQVGSEATATANSSLRVIPTNTVARRGDEALYTPSPLPEQPEPSAVPRAVKNERGLPVWRQSREPEPGSEPIAKRDNASAKMRRRHSKIEH